jgi:hypothetical protein
MTTNTLHTPLEELLFFQSLRANGADKESFAQISETLKANELIHSSDDYQPDRLSPGNLQQLYLRLLKDEARSSSQLSPRSDSEQNGRKRKLSTPPLDSLDEAAKHSHLLPRLVDRLYARYQSHMVDAIRQEEREYFEIQKDIADLERGEWDARLQAEQAARNKPHNGSIQSLLQAESRQADALDNRTQANGTSLVQDSTVNVQKQDDVLPSAPRIPNQHDARSRPAPPAANPFSPVTDGSQPPSRPPSQNRVHNHTQPYHTPLLMPQKQPVVAPSTSTAYKAKHASKPGSPATLPSSSAPNRNVSSPVGPLDSLSEKSTRPYQQSSTPQQSSRHGHLPNLPPHPHTLPQPRNYSPPSYGYSQGHPPPYPQFVPYGQAVPGYPPPQAQSVPPYATPNQPYHANQFPPSNPQYPPSSPYGTFPGFPQGQQPPRAAAPPSQFTTPQPSTARKHALTPINTTVSSTKWRSTPLRSPGKAARRTPSPPARSPMLPSSPEASPEPEAEKSADTSKQHSDLKVTPSRGESTPSRGRGRGRWGNSAGRGRGGRAASSSQAAKDTPTRSQSVASQADEASLDPGTRKGTQEHQSTPLPTTEDNSGMSTPGSAVRPGRRNTLRGVELARPGAKRKRANTTEGSPEVFVPATPHLPSRPGYVLASRNFPRIVAPLMNDINSHKLAAIFAKPITERDVPGYHNLIYRPTDLKSIRAAISLGSRTLAANVAADSSLATPADETGAAATPPVGTPNAASATANKSGTVWVEQGPDVVPPRGIVNSAQLEKEITRMFANAVMFNLDPDRGFGNMMDRKSPSSDMDSDDEDEGVEKHYEADDGGAFVRDAREMFEDVQRSVVGWRKAESRDTGGDTKMRGGEGREESEVDELAGDEEPESSRSRRGRA